MKRILFVLSFSTLLSCKKTELVEKRPSENIQETDSSASAQIQPTVTLEPIETSKSKVSFSDAKNFMEKRCSSIGQILIQSKESSFNGTRVFIFLSTPFGSGEQYCISIISENALEVISSDCGAEHQKLMQWENL